MNGNRKEASDSCDAGIFGTRGSKEEILDLREGHGELGDIIIFQLEDASALIAADPHVQRDQVLKYLNGGVKEMLMVGRWKGRRRSGVLAIPSSWTMPSRPVCRKHGTLDVGTVKVIRTRRLPRARTL